MKRIISKQQEAKKRKRNQFIIGGLLIFVMFFSVLGYSFIGQDEEEENSDKIIYNGFDFFNYNNLWIVNIGDLQFGFSNKPNEIGEIEIDSELNLLNTYSGKPLYIDSQSDDAASELSMNLRLISQRIQAACLNEQDCDENLPIKTCEDNLIVISENQETGIIQNQSCVFIQGPESNLTLLVDRFLFEIIGIE